MRDLFIDIETRSSEDITAAGLYRYVQSPAFRILLFAYAVDGDPVKVVDFTAGERIPEYIHDALFDPSYIKHAYNAIFEWRCLSRYLPLPDPWEWLKQWRCTMHHGAYCGYPMGLAAIGAALGLPQDKQKERSGASLIRTFCAPRADGSFAEPALEPEKWALFKTYNAQDVVTEREVWRELRAYPVPESELELWRLDAAINTRGVRLDLPLAEAALAVYDDVRESLTAEAVKLTGLDDPSSVRQLTGWLAGETGEAVDNLRKDTVTELLKAGLPSDKTTRMLEIRQELAKSSVSKYTAMTRCVGEDGRARGLLQCYGAGRTGRWAGRLVQVQNLPRNHIETLDLARELVRRRRTEAIKVLYGSVPDTLSQLIRTAFLPAPGNTFLIADFSAIEARVIAWLAKETWVMDVFATHGKIYEATAAQMFGVPIERIVKGNPEYELRQRGKVATLALGYQGWTQALINMGALGYGLTEDELPDIVKRWRAANPRICDLWVKIERAVLDTVKTGRQNGVNGVLFALEGDYGRNTAYLTVRLPSGRKLYYVGPHLTVNDRGREAVGFYGLGKNSKKWTTRTTYGGMMTENIVQAIARDCLAVAMMRLTEAGFPIVMHIHDEVVIDYGGEDPGAALDRVCAIMGEPIPWAPGLILKAAGFTSEYYKKD